MQVVLHYCNRALTFYNVDTSVEIFVLAPILENKYRLFFKIKYIPSQDQYRLIASFNDCLILLSFCKKNNRLMISEHEKH